MVLHNRCASKVGWAERSEAQRAELLGFAALSPTHTAARLSASLLTNETAIDVAVRA